MSSLGKDNKNPSGRNVLYKKSVYVFAAVLSVILIYFLHNKYILNESELSYGKQIERIKNIPEPVFKKEGELIFLHKETNDQIQKIDIEIADNDHDTETGLMYRRSMDENKGMLFIFKNYKAHRFWMKNTVIPLDIIYLDSSRMITKIYKSTIPFSEKGLPSEVPVKYTIEVNAGFTEKYGIDEGDRIIYIIQ